MLTGNQWGNFTWPVDGEREVTVLCSVGGETEASGEECVIAAEIQIASYVDELCITPLTVFKYKDSSSIQTLAISPGRLLVYCHHTDGMYDGSIWKTYC